MANPLKQKKIPDRMIDPGCPFFIRDIVGAALTTKLEHMPVQAGLLTLGSPYSPRLPAPDFRAVAFSGFRPRSQRRARSRFSRDSLLVDCVDT
jgi:hypothetical protein